MRISEAAELTGLSISNIRFYEKKGLLAPARDRQSSYRDYTAEDILRLKQILLYRKIDMSIEQIGIILNGESGMEPVLRQQMEILMEKKEKIQSSIDLCGAVLAAPPSDVLDIDRYLDYVKGEEAKGRKFAEIGELLDDIASYTKFDLMAADPIFGRFLKNPGTARVVRFLWSAAMILLPVIVVVYGCLDKTGISPARAVCFIAMFIVMWGPFLRFRSIAQKCG